MKLGDKMILITVGVIGVTLLAICAGALIMMFDLVLRGVY